MRSIRGKLIAIVLMTLLPVTVLFIWYSNLARDTATARLDEQQQVRAPARAETVAQIINGGLSTLRILSTKIPGLDETATVRAMAEIAALPEYTYVALVAPDGEVLLSAPEERSQVNLSDRGWFRRAQQSGEIAVGGQQVGLLSGEPEIALGSPVRDVAGTVTGYLTLGISTDYIGDVLQSVAPPPGTLLTLVDHEGVVVALVPDHPGTEGASFVDAERVLETIRAGGGTIDARGPVGIQRRFTFAPVPGTDGLLFVATGYDPDVVFRDNRVTFRNALTALAVVSAFSMAVAWFSGRMWVTDPVDRLVAITRRIGRGDFDARAELPVDREDELGRLAHEYDEMALSLDSKIRELEVARQQLSLLNADLEERVQARTLALESANKELEAFAYSVSHDLRAPLRSIAGFSQALAEDYGDQLGTDGMSDLERVRAAANRMGDMIDALLTLSRLQRTDMVPEKVDLSALAEFIVGELKEQHPERNVDVDVEPGLVVWGDRTLLEVLMQNLISNAWKFSAAAENASIRIGETETERGRTFFVSDNGAGFDMAYSDKLFGAFQRLHAQHEFPGVGIGLTTAARIVRRHGGEIWAESKTGEGATFYFNIM